MNNDEIEKEEEEGENRLGNKCAAFLLVGVLIWVVGLAWAWRHQIVELIRHSIGEGGWFK
jgi:hypothetical protein